MEIVKYKKKNANVYNVLLSDNTSLSFYDETIIYYNLLAKKSIDEKFLEELISFNKNYDAYYKALKDIKTKLRTEKEIENKLKKLNFAKENISFAISKLKEQGYINDNLFIKSYIADQINLTMKGPNKIILELNKLGFNSNLFNEYFEDYKEIWPEKIIKIINKKIKSNHNLSQAMLQNKIKRDLLMLGYEQNMIDSFIYDIKIDNTIILEREFNKEYKKLSKKYNNIELKYKIKANLYKKGFAIEEINSYVDSMD